MKTFTKFLNGLTSMFCCYAIFCSVRAGAQLPSCLGASSGLIYYVNGTSIYNFDPTQPVSASNPTLNTISLPTGGSPGIALCNNVNVASPSPTFYCIVNGIYNYYNGTGWTSTGHTAGGSINFGGGGGYIYDLGGLSSIWRYDGTANATNLTTISGFSGPADVAADCSGNFYLLSATGTASTSWLKEYNSSGTVINTWTVSGTVGSGGYGLSIIGTNVYFNTSTVYYIGTISGSNVNFVQASTNFSVLPQDFSSCPCNTNSSQNAHDTLYHCSGAPDVQLTALGDSLYSWSVLSGPATINGTGDTVYVTASATSTILSSSVANSNTYIDTVTIIVNPSPIPSISSVNPLCQGASLNLSVNSNPTASTYHWSGPNGFSSSNQNPVRPNIALADSGYYYVSDTLGGCYGKDSVYVSVKPNPALPSAGNNGPLCSGDTLKLSATDATAGVTYTWSGPVSFASSLQNADIPNAQTNRAGTYTVSANLNGCSETASTLVAINPILGTPLVTISVSPNDTICVGQNISLSAIASVGSGFSYQWKRNGTNIAGATSAIYNTASVSNGDLISCFVKSNAPCQLVDSNTSNTITMHVISFPPPPVSISKYPVNYANGDTVTFTGHVPNGSTGLTYTWTKNGVVIPGVTTSIYTTHNVSNEDTICLIVHSSVPCTFPDSTIACTELSTDVLNWATSDRKIRLYPNPAKSILYVEANTDVVISISGIDGKLIIKDLSVPRNSTRQIDLSALANAVYMVHVFDEQGVLIKTEKLVKVP